MKKTLAGETQALQIGAQSSDLLRPMPKKIPMTNLRHALYFVVTLLCALPAYADDAAAMDLPQSNTGATDAGVIRVATRESPPFSYRDERGNWRGLAIDLWNHIARAMDVRYEFIEIDPLPALLDSVATGQADVAASGLTITSGREDVLDFSHPFISSHLSILSIPSRESAWLTLLRRFFSLQFLLALTSLAVVLLTSGAVLYFFERKANPEQFNSQPIKGLGDSFWWSAVTMTTVGYGDKAPITLPGRLVALVWMFLSVIILSTFTASIVSALALEREIIHIEDTRDLRPGRVGTLVGSTSDSYLKRMDLNPRHAESIPALIAELRAGRIDAVVYDAPILRYYLRNSDRDAFSLAPVYLQRQDYGFALTQDSALRQPVNMALLNFLNDARWLEIQERYSASQ